jgi:hypothetical protein
MIDPLPAPASERTALYPRAPETLSEVDRELRVAARARLTELATPPPKEVRDETSSGGAKSQPGP